MNNKDIYSDEFQNALVDIILNINKTNVKEVFDDSDIVYFAWKI